MRQLREGEDDLVFDDAYEAWEDFHGGQPDDTDSITERLCKKYPGVDRELIENIVMEAYVSCERHF